jgi:hypothetical protein
VARVVGRDAAHVHARHIVGEVQWLDLLRQRIIKLHKIQKAMSNEQRAKHQRILFIADSGTRWVLFVD